MNNDTVTTIKELLSLIKEERNKEADYNSTVKSIVNILYNTAWLCSRIWGISGFQASCIGLSFIHRWSYPYNKCGFKIVNYDDMLLPQYESHFNKTISLEAWKEIQKQAKESLNDRATSACYNVKKHWQSIIDGKVPFGYTIEK